MAEGKNGRGVDAAHFAVLGKSGPEVRCGLAPSGGRETHGEMARGICTTAQDICQGWSALLTKEKATHGGGQTAYLSRDIVGAADKQHEHDRRACGQQCFQELFLVTREP